MKRMGLNCTHLFESIIRGKSKAHNTNLDFDRIVALLEFRKIFIIHALVLLSRTKNS
jgi:hypothetical protein